MQYIQPRLLQHKFLDVYRTCRSVPVVGAQLFGLYIRVAAPYSGSISPRITTFTPGHCRIELEDRPHLRNPFQSLHALALLNAGELATGMAFLSITQALDRRAIITNLSADYKKKARGLVVAECQLDADTLTWIQNGGVGPRKVTANITDLDGDVVAVCTADWHVAKDRPTVKAAPLE
ncbi:hypothetical protein BC828DRAFT_372608 [Blastocladiella britannica]|nr:hypothetical protein BC828DRAFT_372608 [Blastocladiella britannica]